MTGTSFADLDASNANIMATFTVAADKLLATRACNRSRLAAEMTNLPNQVVEIELAH